MSMKKIIIQLAGILLGNTLYALGVVLFIVPTGLITGGTTGLGLAFQHFFGIPLSSFVTVFNLLMFFVGLLILGKQFALTTLVSTFYYPLILTVLEKGIGYHSLTSDPLLATLFGGALIGIAIGIVIRCHASTGGMDIPPLIANKLWGLSISVTMYVFDFLILLLQASFTNIEMILYGILLVLCYTLVLDRILMIGQSQTEVFIVSHEHEKINDMIIHELDRGSTLLKAQTGFKKEERPVILTVITHRELPELRGRVLDIDPGAFIIVSAANEVRGRGFTARKEYLSK